MRYRGRKKKVEELDTFSQNKPTSVASKTKTAARAVIPSISIKDAMNGNVKVETKPVENTEKPIKKEKVAKIIDTEPIEVKSVETIAKNIPIPKITETKKVAYTNEEKFAQMSSKNPALMTLKQELSLEFLRI